MLVTYSWDPEIRRYACYISGTPVYGEGATKVKALQNLKEGLQLYVEEAGKDKVFESISKSKIEYEEIELEELVKK